MIGRAIGTTCKRTNRVRSQISRKKKSLLENIYEHFSKNGNRRSAPVLQNDSKNLAKLPELEIVTFTVKARVFSRIGLSEMVL